MFVLFILIAAVGGWIIGRSFSDGDPALAILGLLIAAIGICGNAGVFW